jgi:hypothetical protein
MTRDADPPADPGGAARAVLLLLLVVAMVAGVWLGAGVTRTILTSPTLLPGPVVDSEVLYEKGLSALILDISNSDFVGQLNQGPLHVGQEEVSRILHTTYDTADTRAKAREVHSDLLSFLRSYPDEEIFRISISAERPAMADSLGRVLLEQYAALPECGLGEDLSSLISAARVRFFGESGEDFFSERHPDCRPPEIVAEEVEEGLREEIAEMADSGPESVEAFPDEEGDEDFAALVSQVNRGLFWTHPAWPVLLFLGTALGYARISRKREMGPPAAALGTGLLVYGALVLAVAPGRIGEAFEGAGTEGEASEIWAELGAHAMERTATVSGWLALLAGIGLLGAAALLRFRGAGSRPGWTPKSMPEGTPARSRGSTKA